MDLAMQEVRNGILLDGSQIYRPTTSAITETVLPFESRSVQIVTLGNGQQANKDGLVGLTKQEVRKGNLPDGSQIHRPTTTETVHPVESRSTQTVGNDQQANKNGLFSSNSTDISKKETADLYFDNISYAVKLGFRKGT